MAVGDFNNDGALDVIVAVNNDSPLLLRNRAGLRNHWVGVKLAPRRANPDAVGALVTWQDGDLKRSIFKTAGGSYLSSHDPRLILGIGTNQKIDWVEVKWPEPSGRVERFTNLPTNRYATLVEGQGAAVGKQ
jgi:hypothetical protein